MNVKLPTAAPSRRFDTRLKHINFPLIEWNNPENRGTTTVRWELILENE